MEIHGPRICAALRHGPEAASMQASVETFVRAVGLTIGLVFAHQPACAQAMPASAPAVEPSDAGSVAHALVDAMKHNDRARIRALFAPQASQAYGDGRPKSGPAFFAWLDSDIIDRKGQIDEAKFAVNGSEVIVTGQFRNDQGYRAAANFRLVVEKGRITTWQMRY